MTIFNENWLGGPSRTQNQHGTKHHPGCFKRGLDRVLQDSIFQISISFLVECKVRNDRVGFAAIDFIVRQMLQNAVLNHIAYVNHIGCFFYWR